MSTEGMHEAQDEDTQYKVLVFCNSLKTLKRAM